MSKDTHTHTQTLFLTCTQVTDLNYTFPEDFPAVAKDLVEKLLVVEPEERLGMMMMCTKANHTGI